MNNTFYVTLLIIATLFSCSKNDIPDDDGGGGDGGGSKTITLELLNSPIHFPAQGGSREITVSTNAKSWNVNSSSSWCNVTKDQSSFTVTAEENKSFSSPEKAILTVTAEGTTKKVTIDVTQDAAIEPEGAYIKPVIDRVITNYQGGYLGIGIETNVTNWSFEVDELWCSVEKNSDFSISIAVDETWGGDIPRKALITLYGKDNDSLATITVYQDPLPQLQLFSVKGSTNIGLPSYGGSVTFTVITNVTEFTLGYVGEWLQVDKINDTQFTITSTPNNSSSLRPDQEVIVYASTLTQKLWIFEEEAEETSGNDDYDYTDPTEWD